MKSVTIHHWNGIRADVWKLDRGDKIERHKHAFMHSTGVVQGRTKVTLFNLPEQDTIPEVSLSWEMVPHDQDYAFTPEIEHEIEAIEDGTIVVNLSNAIKSPLGEPGKPGGLMMDTGEVIHDS